MRTTVTLDPDTAALVRRRMRDEGVSFKQAVNDAIRSGLEVPQRGEPFRTRTAVMGTPSINLDRAIQVAGEIEDDELIRKMRLGK